MHLEWSGLSVSEKQYARIEEEVLPIVWEAQKPQTYLGGREFTLVRDHKPLKYFMVSGKAILISAAPRLQSWCLFFGHSPMI